MMHRFWEAQAQQQRDLGLCPSHMDAPARVKAASDLLLGLYEETSEIARIVDSHKRHLLRSSGPEKSELAHEIADALKTLIALSQLYRVTPDELRLAFEYKTLVIEQRARQARTDLSSARIACFDLDGVLCNIDTWLAELKRLRGDAPPNAKTLKMMEDYKTEFYVSGRFAKFPAVEGGPEAVRAIRDLGYKIVMITARPQWQFKRLQGDTLVWLEANQIPCDVLLFNKDKVEALHQHVSPAWPVGFVEDHERNIRSLAAAGVPTLVYPGDGNSSLDVEALPGDVRRVRGWGDVVDYFSASVVCAPNNKQ